MNTALCSKHFAGVAIALALILLPAFAPAGGAVEPDRLTSLITQLGSDNPTLRQNALENLMKLRRADLPELREAAIALAPLQPGQVAALHQAVTQVFLAGESYRVDPDFYGFLGVRWARDLPMLPRGILVDERIPGFAGYQYLRPGDVILGFPDLPQVELRIPDDFIAVVHRLAPGDSFRINVLRNGSPIVIKLTLDCFPIDATRYSPVEQETWLQNWMHDRAQKAEYYWNTEFSVIDSPAVPVAMR